MAVKRVDDRSSAIIYAGGWGFGGAQTDYNDSVAYATLAGQTATLSFQGIGISVFGHTMAASPGIPPPVSSYSIDGGTPTIFNEVQDGVEHPDQQFYQSPILSNTKHTIVVTNVYNNHAAYFLDYFLVVSGGDTPTSAPAPPAVTTAVAPAPTSAITSKPSSNNGGTPAVPSTTILSMSQVLSTKNINGTIYTVTITPSVAADSSTTSAIMGFSSTSSTSDSKRPTAIIIGSCIGGVAAVVLLALIAYYWLHKRRRSREDWRNISQFSNPPHTSEWFYPAGPSSLSGRFPKISQPIPESVHGQPSVAPRPPSYSQEPPEYNPSNISYTQSPHSSKMGN